LPFLVAKVLGEVQATHPVASGELLPVVTWHS
jgi:hypothetical protein